MNQYFRQVGEYSHQTAKVDGRSVGADLNLYKLFTERCFHLARPGGHVGIVIPSGIYTDLGAKGLRDLLFNEAKIEGLFCFENRKTIFEGVDSRFKFVVLTFEKPVVPRLQATGERNSSAPPDDLLAPSRVGALTTQTFPVAFMRHDVAELARFPDEGALWLDLNLIRKLSPDSNSLMEFKGDIDLQIAKKLMQWPSLGERIDGRWNLEVHRELHMTDDAPAFKPNGAEHRLQLVEGKMIHQFEFGRQANTYWIAESDGRNSLLGRQKDIGQQLSYQRFRLAYRAVASSTNERTMISTIISPGAITGNSLHVGFEPTEPKAMLILSAMLNGFAFDFQIRQQVTSNLTMFFIYQTRVPRIDAASAQGAILCERAAKLICTTPQFDDLAKQVGLRDHRDGVTDPAARGQLRAELDGLVAHLYGLTEDEFAHILTTFPLVPEPTKQAARNAYRDVERGLIR